MPQAAAAWLAGAILANTSWVAAAVFVANYGAAIISAGLFAITTAQQQRSARRAASDAQSRADASYSASVTNRTAVVRSPIVPRNIVFGRDRTSGPLACWFTWGSIQQYHTFAVVLAGHECDAVEQVYFNGAAVTVVDNVVVDHKYTKFENSQINETLYFDATGFATSSQTFVPGSASVLVGIQAGEDFNGNPLYIDSWVPASTISSNRMYIGPVPGLPAYHQVTYTHTSVTPLFNVWVYLGAPGQSASSQLIAAAAASGNPSAWDESRRGTGVCYLVVQMIADYDVLGQIGVPNISAVVRGVKAYDPRSLTTAWTQNPALLARWFLVDSIYSPTTLSSEVGADQLTASANVCDEWITIGHGLDGNRYTANGQLSSDGSPLDNLNRILDAMDGDAVWVCGAWQLTAGYHRPSSLTLDESALNSADIKINPYLPKDKLFNQVTGTYVSPALGYVRTSYPLMKVDAYVTEDNGEELPVPMDFDLVNDQRRCSMIAWQRLTRARQQLTSQFGTNLKGYDLWPTETVTLVQKEFYGATPKEFTVNRREFANGQLTYVVQETGSAVWAWDYTLANQPVNIPNTSLPNPFDLPTPVITTLRSGDAELLIGDDGTITSRIYFEVAATSDFYIINGGSMETQYAIAGTLDWQAGPVCPGSQISDWLSPVEDGQTYAVQARYRNSANRVSPWSIAALHEVIGKREPPPDILEFTVLANAFAWSAVAANDLAGYQLRFNYGQNTAWGTATPLHSGIVTESPWTPENYPSGQITVLIKAQDTTGNQSATAAAIVTNLGDPLVANIVETYDDKAAGFPGVKTNGTVVSGDLVADDSGDLFWGAIEGNFWGADAAPFWPTSTYLRMTYVTGYNVTVTEVQSRLTLITDIEAESYTIEFRFGTQGLFWDADGDYFWRDDADLFWPIATAWQTWPGEIDNVIGGEIELRIITQVGETQGAIRELTLQFDVEDETEFLNDVSIAPGGTRLVLTKSYRSIKNILMTAQALGGDTPIPTTVDKNVTLGPLVATYEAGVSVAGKIDAQIQGVKGL